MKITIIPTIILSTFLFTACSETDSAEAETNTTEIETNAIEEITDEPAETVEMANTVTDEQIAHYEELLALTSTESDISDCYISETFIYNDASYITVDFVSYFLVDSTAHTDNEVYTLINENTALRTFAVNNEYYNCGHDKMIPLSELIEQNKATKDLVFRIEVEDGIVLELFLDNCSG